jgi:hypothetical protein
VANLAARLFQECPAASSNLIRALIADSARVPPRRPSSLAGLGDNNDRLLRIYGYGQPEFIRARWSAENAVLIIAEERIEVDSFLLFARAFSSQLIIGRVPVRQAE